MVIQLIYHMLKKYRVEIGCNCSYCYKNNYKNNYNYKLTVFFILE